MASPNNGLPLGRASNLKIVLLILASACVVGLLYYSGRIVDELLDHERQTADLYARSIEFTASETRRKLL